MVAKGGKREGAGRKKGSINKRTSEFAKKIATTNQTPLQVLIDIMQENYTLAKKQENVVLKESYLKIALEAAKNAAPYVHAKLSSVDLGNKDNKPLKMEISWS